MSILRLLIFTIVSAMGFFKTSKSEKQEPIRLAKKKPRTKKPKRKVRIGFPRFRLPRFKFELPISKTDFLVILIVVLLFVVVVSSVFYYGALESTHVYNNNHVV